jgi:hypothetical protein
MYRLGAWWIQINVSENPAAVLFRIESENRVRFPRGRVVTQVVSRRLLFLIKSRGVCGGYRFSPSTSVSTAIFYSTNYSIFINHPVMDSILPR